MGDRLKLGIVGCGDIAGYTAFFAHLNRGIELAACCDISIERAEAFASRYGIRRTYSDYAQLLDDVQLDAIYLAVPHHLHNRMIQAAVARKLPVLSEKPITRTLSEGLEVVNHARQAGVKVAVNYQYRYDSGCYALARAVQEGAIGEVRYARINVPWHRRAEYFHASSWHQTIAQAGGGTLLTQGSHFLDIALWACGQRTIRANGQVTQRVYQDVEVEDLAMGIIELQNGALVEVCSSMAAASEQPVSIEIYGSKGTAVYTNHPLPRVHFRGMRVRQAQPPVWGVHALQRSIEGFRRWVAANQEYLVPAEAALPVLAAVEAIYRSAASGKTELVQPLEPLEAAQGFH